MKQLLLLLLVLNISCGKLEDESKKVRGIEAIGNDFVVEEDESFSESESSLIDEICTSLESKSSVFGTMYLNKSGKNLTYSSSFTDCNGAVSANDNVELKLVSTSAGINFVPAKTTNLSQNLYFSEYETDSIGILKGLCGSEEKRRYNKIGSSLATRLEVVTGASCQGQDTGTFRCLAYAQGTKISGSTYRPFMTQFVRFSLSSGVLNGVVDFRQEKQPGSCDDGKSTLKQSRFKSRN